ncbi:MAG TPA: histidine kinase [Actinomycetes bacterium]|nr:histidine kinase [Actinomycetes bacterium]
MPYVVATIACWLVGVVLTGRAFEQPAGWAFLGLGTSLAWSGLTDVYAELALVWRPDLPAGPLVATLSDTSFVWWFVFLALVLQLTPPARASSRLQRSLPRVTVAAGLVYQVTALLRSTHLDSPHEDLISPWAVDHLSGLVSAVASMAVILVGLCLIASAVGLVRAWRRSEGQTRQQLLWLVAGALPLPPCVIASFAVSYAGHPDVAGYLMSAAIIALAAGAALSVLRYRLYDVERVVTDSAGYAIASAAVIVSFVVVVVVVSRTTPIDASSQLPTILATLAGAGTARVAYVWGRKAVERRINRERFDALETVRTGLTTATPDLDALVTAALQDPGARILYPADGGTWVTSGGREISPGPDAVDLRRRGAVTARIEFDPRHSERTVVEAVAHEVAAEIDNVALRAELARQVELISESRSRLATAHLEERRRIERDLHDGAQQRLLAIALQLQSAQVNGRTTILRVEVDRAIAQLGLTVQELRNLAGGLQPAALAGGGLLAAVVDLASRLPLNVTYHVVDQRFPASIEGAAWFVIAEATTNVVKHADVLDVSITVMCERSVVRVTVADRGVGHASTRGTGLQGLADRVSALRGCLRVTENLPHGTIVEAELPCGS